MTNNVRQEAERLIDKLHQCNHMVDADDAVDVVVKMVEALGEKHLAQLMEQSILFNKKIEAETARCIVAIDKSWPKAKGLVKHAVDAIRQPQTEPPREARCVCGYELNHRGICQRGAGCPECDAIYIYNNLCPNKWHWQKETP